MGRVLRVLILEDCPEDAELMVRALSRTGFAPEWQRAQTEEGLLACLDMKPEVILSDYSMPRFNGLQALACVRRTGLDIPFIIVSGTTGEDIAVAAMREGVDDYLLKDRLARLGLAVKNALERKLLRDRERQQVSQLRLQAAAMEAAASSIIITDRDGTVRWANPAFTAMTGYARQEIVGQTPRILRSGMHDQAFYQRLWQTVLAGGVWRGEVINKRKDGTLYHEDMTITPVYNDDGEVAHFIAVKQDITERRHLEAQLLQAQKMESFGRLAGGVAHDFNNLLTVICGSSDVLLSTQPTRELAVSLLGEIRRAGERAAGLTKQLLAFSRKQVLQPQVLDLNALVADVEKMLRRLIGEDIELVVEPAGDLRRVKADPSQLQQVLMNLAVNARDAMPHGGKLSIVTRNVEADSCGAAAPPQELGGWVELAVSDTGCGMPPDVLTHIFEPFFTTKEAGKGTGLGLATAYGIVAQSGGRIDVQSEPGKGSTFRIFLPPTTDSASGPRTGGAVSPPPQGKETILLVEDDEAVRTLAGLILRRAGYTVLQARNGKEALRIIEHHASPIDLMLTDVVMPEMSGRHVADALGARKPATRVLYMSGYLDDTVVRYGVIHSGLAFLPKPFTTAALLGKVREVLDGGPQQGVRHVPAAADPAPVGTDAGIRE